MLCLTRMPGQKILIGDAIVVEIVEVSGRRVRLGIVAPRDVPVHREEVADAIRRDGAGGGGGGGGDEPQAGAG